MALHLQDQGRQATDSIDGFSAQVTYNVDGVSSETQALEHIGLPRIGESHPERSGTIVLSATARPNGVGVYLVTVNYGVPKADQSFQPSTPGATGIIELGAASTDYTTNRDIETGDPIVVRHTYIEELAVGNVEQRTEKQSAEIEVEVSHPLLIQRRQETFPPIARTREYSNTVNRHRIWGFEEGTLLCLPITAVSNDGGATWTTTYQFQAAEEWTVEARFRDRTSGKPPVDLVRGKGIVEVNVYRKADFSGLGLTFPGFN